VTDEKSKPMTPVSLGYSMPAEWSLHRATWLAWPHNNETWPTQLEEVRDVWVEMIRALSPYEQVCLLINDEKSRNDVVARLKKSGGPLENVSIVELPTVDVWMRDYGPTFVTRKNPDAPLASNDWIFNGWGGKYPSYERDDQIAKALASMLGIRVFEHPIVLEGGSIEVNGEGICLTTEQCLLNENRNPHLNRSEIEQCLKDSLGVSHVIWLGEGIAGDDTDGHIDDIARFVNRTTIVCVVESDPKDENYSALQDNYERLQDARDPDGTKLSTIKLPSPSPIFWEGSRLPASYANFYIANAVVLVPTFNDPRDREALGLLQELFPERKVVGIPSNALVAGLGAIHCVTQQEPRNPS
jgi:agmatine deiminase